ncbi:MAG: hypothetical protein EAZ39_25395 [Oscillatoriales cyanobacterium]|nr:MAG: hypothetical protein EAZ86_22480 [Oscillatoriales cyanobacterium]TAF89519.1 MAG: hypothetical protein EAZ49_12650 [Oscillatoriales cyanobacterium]TAG05252.1 MAG: hypothetical protein EAZ45_06255 [Oscillatoriales cyanobacterium]TAG14217.1 MAG: hypothetical protein EAZ39_25395 [Oscillatoriales cyanobacterium]TAG42304.1 MAG: hypothetical protein EAZ33_15505 [Oscillatoriales cyanobacterium]
MSKSADPVFYAAAFSLKLRYCTIVNKPFMNRQDACSTRDEFFCGTGILPVPENGVRRSVKTKLVDGGSKPLLN